MGLVYENECCDCAVPAYPCLGDRCPLKRMPRLYCDECKEEVEVLYKTEKGLLCADCVLEMFEKVRLD